MIGSYTAYDHSMSTATSNLTVKFKLEPSGSNGKNVLYGEDIYGNKYYYYYYTSAAKVPLKAHWYRTTLDYTYYNSRFTKWVKQLFISNKYIQDDIIDIDKWVSDNIT